MKKLKTIVFTLALIAACFMAMMTTSISASAEEILRGVTDNGLCWEYNELTRYCVVYDYIANEKNVVIPDWINEIGNLAFDNSDIESVVITGDIAIGQYSFLNCTSLKSVRANNETCKITSLGLSAFDGCNQLEEIPILSKEVTEIPDCCFYMCQSLKAVKSEGTIDKVGKRAFGICHAITEVPKLSAKSQIGESAFLWCNSLRYIKGVGKIKSLAKYSFQECQSLVSIPELEAGIEIPEYSFCGTALYDIKGDKTISKIGKGAFEFCKNLKTLDLSNCKEIEDYAFLDCEKLEKVKFSNELQYVGEEIFSNTDESMEIEIPCNAYEYIFDFFKYYNVNVTHEYENSKKCVHCGKIDESYEESTTGSIEETETTEQMGLTYIIKKIVDFILKIIGSYYFNNTNM